MPSVADREAVSVRLPAALKARAGTIAKSRKLSLNQYVADLIARDVQEVDDKELFDSFTELGMDAQMEEVEFTIHAAAEVMLSD